MLFETGKLVAAICHAPWTLIGADVVHGRTLTSWPSLQTDVPKCRRKLVDEELVIDDGLITSRKPDDLPAFCGALVEQMAQRREAEHRRLA